MTAAELMTQDPVTVQPDDEIGSAISLLQETSLRHLPVVDANGELVGMVSDRDLRALLVPYFHPQETGETFVAGARAPVSTIMSSNVVSVDMEDDVSRIAELMVEHRVAAVPVLDGDGKLVGIVSYVDLVRHYARQDD